MVKVLIPWRMNFYQKVNGFHPLLASIVDGAPDGIEFVYPDDSVPFADGEITRVGLEYMKTSYQYGRLPLEANVNVSDYIMALLHTRDPAAQMRMESFAGKVDVVFHHTAPLHVGTLPFVLHFENLTTLFWPFLMAGRTRDLVLEYQPIFHIIRTLLESPACRGIVTHLKGSLDALTRAFDSPAITAKAHHVPLGVGVPPAMEERIARKLRQPPKRMGLNILFTNSMNRHTTNFVARGGWEVLAAFERLLAKDPDARLTVVSNKPEVAGFERLRLRNVTWIEQGIDDDALYELLLEADLFALPAAALHSYSALRAMKFGAVLLCSDVPGYEEYVADGESGIIIPGRFAQAYQPDPQTGWMREDFSEIYKPSQSIIAALGDAFERLAENPEERHRLAVAGYEHVTRNHALGPWVDGNAALLRGHAKGA